MQKRGEGGREERREGMGGNGEQHKGAHLQNINGERKSNQAFGKCPQLASGQCTGTNYAKTRGGREWGTT